MALLNILVIILQKLNRWNLRECQKKVLIDKFDRFGRLKFKEIFLKQDSVSFLHKK